MRLLGVHSLRERLGDRFKVLTGSARTALHRHQTLRATIDWSYSLLRADEQTVLRRLGVFVGGFSLELAQRVCSEEGLDEWAVLEALGTLVDKSLVAVDAGEPLRYRLLETTRAYALERLADVGETARLLQRHAHAVRDLFVRTEDQRFGDNGTLDMASLLQRLTPEIDNWRAALDWAVGDGAEPATATALAGSGALVLPELGRTQEAIDRLLPLRSLLDDGADASRAAAFWLWLMPLGWISRLPRDVLLEAAARCERLYRAIGSRRRLIVALCWRARSHAEVGEDGAAETMLPEIIGLETADDPAWLRSIRLNVQGIIYVYGTRFEQAASVHAEARALLLQAPGEQAALRGHESNLSGALLCLERFEEAIALAHAARQRHVVRVHGHALGRLLVAQTALGRLDDAWDALREALPVWRRDALLYRFSFAIAALFARSGYRAEAARVDGAAMARYRRIGALLVPAGELAREHMQAAFDAAGFAVADIERWRREGEAMDEEQVATLCETVLSSRSP